MCACVSVFVYRCVFVLASPFFLFFFKSIVAFYFVLSLSRDGVANAARRVQGPSVSVEDG